jgi:multidrug efflux pump subunit AcrA (membrane-fusion protein)
MANGEAITTVSAATSESVLESLPIDPKLLETANWWFDVSWYGILWSGAATAIAACATVAFLFVQYWSSGIKERQSEWRTSELELQTAQAKKDTAIILDRAAQAEQKAAEANLALAQLKEPRSISQKAAVAITERVARFSGTPFDMAVIPGDPEALPLIGQLADALRVAGWTWIEFNHPSGPFMTVYSVPGLPNIGHGGGIGISIAVHPDHLSEFSGPANALIAALNSEGFSAQPASVSEGTPNHDTIHIIIGKKPL